MLSFLFVNRNNYFSMFIFCLNFFYADLFQRLLHSFLFPLLFVVKSDAYVVVRHGGLTILADVHLKMVCVQSWKLLFEARELFIYLFEFFLVKTANSWCSMRALLNIWICVYISTPPYWLSALLWPLLILSLSVVCKVCLRFWVFENSFTSYRLKGIGDAILNFVYMFYWGFYMIGRLICFVIHRFLYKLKTVHFKITITIRIKIER